MIGKRVAEIYIDPLTAHEFIESLKEATIKPVVPFSFLQMVSNSLEIRPQLRVKVKEVEDVQEFLVKYDGNLLMDEPSMFLPYSKKSSSTILAGTVTCCSLPMVSVKRRSTNLYSSSLIFFKISVDIPEILLKIGSKERTRL